MSQGHTGAPCVLCVLSVLCVLKQNVLHTQSSEARWQSCESFKTQLRGASPVQRMAGLAAPVCENAVISGVASMSLCVRSAL